MCATNTESSVNLNAHSVDVWHCVSIAISNTLRGYGCLDLFSYIESTWQLEAYIEMFHHGLKWDILKLEEL